MSQLSLFPKPKIFRVCRFGNADLETNLRTALIDHYQHANSLPTGITVNKDQLTQAYALAIKLQLTGCEIYGSGGCLANEIWLEV
jgi:hypothetical protein